MVRFSIIRIINISNTDGRVFASKIKTEKVSEVSSSVCPLQVKALYTDAISDRKLLSHCHLHSIIRIHID